MRGHGERTMEDITAETPCPHCQADPGEDCTMPCGQRNPTPHVDRRNLFADARLAMAEALTHWLLTGQPHPPIA